MFISLLFRHRPQNRALNVVGSSGLPCFSAVLGSPCQGAGGLRMRARPPARRAAYGFDGTPRRPLRGALGHGVPALPPPLSAVGLGTAVAASPRFLSATALSSARAFHAFPLGAVARGLPHSMPARMPADLRPFLSRAWREGCALPAAVLRIPVGALTRAHLPAHHP